MLIYRFVTGKSTQLNRLKCAFGQKGHHNNEKCKIHFWNTCLFFYLETVHRNTVIFLTERRFDFTWYILYLCDDEFLF